MKQTKNKIHWTRKIIPKIFALVTRSDRYLPKFEWNHANWSYNAFRLWELIFWRKVGIYPETSVSCEVDEEGKKHCVYRFYTLESMIVHIEGMTRITAKRVVKKMRRSLNIQWKNLIPKVPEIYIPRPAFAIERIWTEPPIGEKPRGYVFAIAFDASASGDFGGSPDTFNLTTSGSDRILFISQFNQTSASSASYNSVSATDLGGYSYSSPTGVGRLYMLVAPASGTNQVSVSAGGNLIAVASSYSGAKQTGQPDASINTQTSGGSNASSLTATITVVSANSWLIAGTICEGAALTAGTGAHLRQTGSNPAVAMFDSNGAVSTGSQSMTVNESPSNKLAMGMVSFAVASNTYNQSVTATSSIIGSLTKGLSKTLTVTPAVSGSVLKQMAKSMTATATVTANMVKQMAKALTASVVVTGILTATKVTLKTLTATVAVTASIAKIPGKVLSGTAAVTANLAKTATLTRTLQATAAVTGVVLKGLSKTLTATSAVSAVLTKVPGKLLQASAAITATLDKTQAKILTATAAVTASMTAGRAVIMTAAVATTATLEKTVGKLLAVTLSITAKVLAPFWRTKYPSHGDEDDYQIKYPHD